MLLMVVIPIPWWVLPTMLLSHISMLSTTWSITAWSPPLPSIPPIYLDVRLSEFWQIMSHLLGLLATLVSLPDASDLNRMATVIVIKDKDMSFLIFITMQRGVLSNVLDVGVMNTVIVIAMRNRILTVMVLWSRLRGRVVAGCPCKPRWMTMSPCSKIAPMTSSNACQLLWRYHDTLIIIASYCTPHLYPRTPCIHGCDPSPWNTTYHHIPHPVISFQALFLFLALVCYFTGTFIALTIFVVKRHTRLVKASQPLMMMFIVAGSMLGSTRILMSYFDLTNAVCQANIWYVHIHRILIINFCVLLLCNPTLLEL